MIWFDEDILNGLEPLKDFILTSEVKVDLGDQISFYILVHNWAAYKLVYKIWWVVKDFILTSVVKESNLTSKVKVHLGQKLCI